MLLTLIVNRYKEYPPERTTSVSVGEQGGTIGREPDNDLVLTDPDHWISRHHALVRFRDGAYTLTNTGINGTFVNHGNNPLREGDEVVLHDGDELTIGAYDVRVSIDSGNQQIPAAFDPFPAGEQVQEPFPGTPSGGDAQDILEMVGPGSVTPPPAPPHTPPEERLPLDLEDLLPPEPPAHDVSSRGPAPSPRATPTPPAEPDHTPDENAFFRPPEVISEVIPDGYIYDPVTDELKPAPVASPAGPPVPETQEPEPHPAPAVSSEPPVQPVRLGIPPTPPVQDTPGDGAILKAFLTGLGGGEAPSDPESRAQLMRTSGELLRTMTQGLMKVMMGRASFKSELRLAMTTIRSSENNPFKFSVDSDDALAHMLFRPGHGFLPPIEAATEAFDDVQAHEMAMIAGLRAALRALLARFDPSDLEQRFRDRSVLDNLVPMARKAKYWELFTEIYGEVSADAEEDFLHLFGEAFTRAYEDQVDHLKQIRKKTK